MEKNVGQYDRTVRLGLGTGLLIAGILGVSGLFGSGPIVVGLGAVSILIGAILAVTGLTQTCLLYSPLGIDTS